MTAADKHLPELPLLLKFQLRVSVGLPEAKHFGSLLTIKDWTRLVCMAQETPSLLC